VKFILDYIQLQTTDERTSWGEVVETFVTLGLDYSLPLVIIISTFRRKEVRCFPKYVTVNSTASQSVRRPSNYIIIIF